MTTKTPQGWKNHAAWKNLTEEERIATARGLNKLEQAGWKQDSPAPKYCHPAFGCDCDSEPSIPSQTRSEALDRVDDRLAEIEQAIAAFLMAVMDYRYGPDKG